MQGLYIDWSKLHWTPELLNYFWVWSWFGEWKMDVTSVLKTLPEGMMLVPGCAGTVVSSTSLLTGLLHKEWVAVLACSCLCAALQLFVHFFLKNGLSEFSERFDFKRKCWAEGIKKSPIQTQQRIASFEAGVCTMSYSLTPVTQASF